MALWRVAAGDGAATRHGHRHESTARDRTWARRTLTVYFGAILIEIDSQERTQQAQAVDF